MVELPCKHYNHGANNMISERSEMGKQNGIVTPRGKMARCFVLFSQRSCVKKLFTVSLGLATAYNHVVWVQSQFI